MALKTGDLLKGECVRGGGVGERGEKCERSLCHVTALLLKSAQGGRAEAVYIFLNQLCRFYDIK